MKACKRNESCEFFPANANGKCTISTCTYWSGGKAESLDEIKVGSPARSGETIIATGYDEYCDLCDDADEDDDGTPIGFSFY